MALLNLIETIQTKLSTLTKKDGQLIVVRDNASLYVDLDGSRIYISDWIDVSTDTERLSMLTPLSNKYYYVVETNKIWRYVSGNWVQVTLHNASDVMYDNTTSGLTATNVNGAIDEINETVVDVESKLSDTILPQYKNYVFPATGWYRVAEVNSNYQYLTDLHIIRTFANTPPEVHKISIGHAQGVNGFGFLNEASVGYELMIPKVRVTQDGANNQYIEVYCDYKSSGNNIVIMLSNQINSRPEQWSLVDAVSTDETVEGITVIGTHEFSANKSYESEIDTINQTLNKTTNLFDGNYKFVSFDKSSESATIAGIQEILKTVANSFGLKQVFVHIVFTASTSYDYWGHVTNSNYAVFDEATPTLTEKRRFILRNGSWTVATLAEESDVTALQTNINALNHTNISYTAATKTEALAYLDNPITIDFIGPNRSCYNFHFVDTVGDSPLGGGVTMISGYTYGDGKNGAQIALKYDGTMKVRYQKNSTWSDWKLVGDATYKDISSSIDVGDTGCTASGYVENGQVFISVVLPAGKTANTNILTITDSKYFPRNTVALAHYCNDANDVGVITCGAVNYSGEITVMTNKTNTKNIALTASYPLKTS